MNAPASQITIRPAYADDAPTLLRLAALDSADAPPPTPLLVGEKDGDLCVAMSLRDGSVIADPFVATADIVELLRARAKPARTRRLRPSVLHAIGRSWTRAGIATALRGR
jgi:hypothetical protein